MHLPVVSGPNETDTQTQLDIVDWFYQQKEIPFQKGQNKVFLENVGHWRLQDLNV